MVGYPNSDILSVFFFSSRRRHTRYIGDWSSDVCSSDLAFVDNLTSRTLSTKVSPAARTVNTHHGTASPMFCAKTLATICPSTIRMIGGISGSTPRYSHPTNAPARPPETLSHIGIEASRG